MPYPMHNEHVFHLEEHSEKRFDDNNILSVLYEEEYLFFFVLVVALVHASVDVRILYKANHHQVSEPENDSHQE